MAARAVFLRRLQSLHRIRPNPSRPPSAIFLRLISTSRPLNQEPQLQDQVPDQDTSSSSPLPPSPSTGSPFYSENWRNPAAASAVSSVVPLAGSAHLSIFSRNLSASSIMDVFADWMTSQRWSSIKELFEFWIRSLDASGKPNMPDVNLYNHYLRANLMMGALAAELLDIVAQMQDYEIEPNTASYNLVLKAMCHAKENDAAEKLIDRMLLIGTLPDDESYNLLIGLLISVGQMDSALRYLDLTLKSGFTVTSNIFMDCVRKCIYAGRLDTLASIIEKCKTSDQNKSLCPSWNLCNDVADVAMQADHSKLAFFALEFLARFMVRGENARPPVFLSVDEGLVVLALGTAARTLNPTLLNATWSILRRSLRDKRPPNPESFLAKIYAHSSLGNLQSAFSTLSELENVHGKSEEVYIEMFSPFTSLYPLVMACCKNGFSTLDSVYIQLESLSQAESPYKSVAALNCVILGCANIWDLDRAYETFDAISSKIGLTPDIHSYNALMCAFGKLRKTSEASKVFEHLTSLGVKPNATTYSLLVDAHLVNRDQKASLAIIDEMIDAGFTPSKETLRKIRRRCSRESDFDSDDKVQALARKFNYRMGSEARREMLYNLEYSTTY